MKAPGWNEWRPLPKPAGTEAHFGSLVTLDGEIHAVMGDGDLYRLAGDRQSWVRVRGIEGFPSQGTVGDFFRVFGYGPAYWLRFGGTGSTDLFHTRDFREVHRVPLVDGWHFLGTFSGADALLYRSDDRRTIGLFDGDGTLVHQVTAPFAVDTVSDLGNGTYLAASDGIRWIFGRDGNFFPLEIPDSADAVVWRTGFHVVLLGPRGHVTRFAANDFHARSLSVQEVEHGAENRLHAWLNLRNDGILAMGADTRIRVSASLEPSDGGNTLSLGDSMVDVSGMVPGVSRFVDLSFSLPEALPLGDYRLVADINTDGRIPETNTANNSVKSPVFAYNPDITLIIEPARFGTVRTDQMTASMPYGTTVTVEAEPPRALFSSDGTALRRTAGRPTALKWCGATTCVHTSFRSGCLRRFPVCVPTPPLAGMSTTGSWRFRR